MICDIIQGNCVDFLRGYEGRSIDLSFLDPPFNQAKEYRNHNDKMETEAYWNWMQEVCELIFKKSSEGASIYFMQREKNTH